MITVDDLSPAVPVEVREPIPLDTSPAIMPERELRERIALIDERRETVNGLRHRQDLTPTDKRWLNDEYDALMEEQMRLLDIVETPFPERMAAYRKANPWVMEDEVDEDLLAPAPRPLDDVLADMEKVGLEPAEPEEDFGESKLQAERNARFEAKRDTRAILRPGGKPLELMSAAELSERLATLESERERLAAEIQTNRMEDELEANQALYQAVLAQQDEIRKLRARPLFVRRREYEKDRASTGLPVATAKPKRVRKSKPKLTPEQRSEKSKIGGRARMARLSAEGKKALARKGHEASCVIVTPLPAPTPCPPCPPPTECMEGYRGAACGELVTPQGRERSCYVVMPISSLVTSHNPESWRADPLYPAQVQERDYTRDREEQAKVGRIAKNPDPAILLANNPTPADGPPVVTGSGIVLGGNGRTMGLKLAYSMGTAGRYVDELKKRAPMFGLTEAQVTEVDRPVLVRVIQGLDAAPQSELADASSRYNEALTGSLDEKAKGVSDSRRLSPETLSVIATAIEKHETLRKAMAEDGAKIVAALRNDGVITPQNSAAMVNPAGGLSEAGKMRVEGAFLGLAAGTPERLAQASPATVQKLERIVPFLAAVRAINPEADAIPTFQAALDLLSRAEAAGMSLDQFLEQGELFAAEGAPSAPTAALEEAAGPAPVATSETAAEPEAEAPEAGVISIERARAHAFNPEGYSKLVADSPDEIRGSDVERLFDEAPVAHRPELADWLRKVRPDLKGQVNAIMQHIAAADRFFDAKANYHILGVPGLMEGTHEYKGLTKQEFIDRVEAGGEFKHKGQELSPHVRPELQGQPTFDGLNGPSWGGDGPAYEVNATWAEEKVSGVAHGTPRTEHLTKKEAIERIKAGLRKRSGKMWSAESSRGTGGGYFYIKAPPKRLNDMGRMTPEDCAELGKLLGLPGPVDPQGKSVSPDPGFYEEYVDRAWGREPARRGVRMDHD